ncbi:MAG: DUF2612 domain-containing protein [Planctomycetes bacterium]|nr:DUF2612 domain-containing protein [Planctomycetota bacterium]
MASIEVEDTLKARLFSRFRNSPNIIGLIEILSDPLQDTVDACDFILANKSIDDSEGEQLDFIGELIGVYRPLQQEDPSNIFTMCSLGEADDLDGSTGFFDDTDTVEIGGYMTSYVGIPDQSDPTAEMEDAPFRILIKQKASSYRKKPTRLNLFNYLIAFGSRCKIDDDTAHTIVFDPVSYYDLNDLYKWYVENKGFKPAGISVDIEENLRKVLL